MPTIKTILTKYPLKLSKISSTAKLDVEVILSFAINKPKEFLYTHPEYKLTEKQNQKFNCLIKRRLKNEPIAYITGEKEFYELNFIVNKNTLIPRPETELLVNETIKEIISIRRSHLRRNCGRAEKTQKHKNTKTQKQIFLPFSKVGWGPPPSQRWVGGLIPPPAEGVRGRVAVPPFRRRAGGIFPPLHRSLPLGDCGATAKQQQIILIDIGTGSGCIPISILKNLPKNIREKIKIYAIDISPKALTLAKKNARLRDVEKKIKFIKSDLLDEILQLSSNPPTPLVRGASANSHMTRGARGVLKNFPLSQRGVGGIFNSANIIITANLPYISTPAYKKLSPDIKKYEPKNALVAGNDGLKYYRQLFRQIQKINSHHKPPSRGGAGGGLNITLLIEIDFKTMCPKSKLKKTIKQYLPNSKIEIKKDLGGAERVMVIKKVSDTL